MTSLVTVIMIFSIPIIGIITEAFNKNTKLKHKMLKDELELEKLKQDNFILETEKMRIELEQMKQQNNSTKDDLLSIEMIKPDRELEPVPVKFSQNEHQKKEML